METKVIKTKENPAKRLGQYAITGGPGRPPGSKNKFTLIKEEMVDIWHESNGKEKLKEMFEASPDKFLKALDRIISILPKEALVDQSTHTQITYAWNRVSNSDGVHSARLPDGDSPRQD